MNLIEPKDSEVRRLAYELFELRGGGHGWDLADWVTAKRAARFHKNYERVFFSLLSAPKVVHVAKSDPRKCRFCKRTQPEAKFGNDAHAVPAFLGNRSIFSKSECNGCNSDFSKSLEDHFARFLHGARTSVKMRGRKGIPKYTTPRNLSRIEVRDDRLEIHLDPLDPLGEVNSDTSTATFPLPNQPYSPLAVYKCLTKVALSLMSDTELLNFADSMAWVLEQDHSQRADIFGKAVAFLAFTPGLMPDRYGWVELFRRRHHALRIPYMVLVLVAMNFTFQIYVPLSSKDHHLVGETVTMPSFPAGINGGYEFGETEFTNMPVASPDLVTNTATVIWKRSPLFD